MKKLVVVKFSDNSVLSFPADFVAKDKADKIAKSDSNKGFGRYENIYREEYHIACGDDDGLVDWVRDQMTFESVKSRITWQQGGTGDETMYSSEFKTTSISVSKS